MKTSKLIFLFLSLTTIISAQEPLNPADFLPLDASVRTGTLTNGIKYFIKKNAKPENRAELRLVVNAGSTMENEDQQGLAHFVEHMAFNGTKNFQKNDLVNYLESIGTEFGPDLNAYTSFDETVYMLQIPTDNEEIYKKGFLVLEDWAHNLSFDSLEIEKERGVVLEEWRLGQGANERMERKYWPLLFKDSRYAVRLPIGQPEVLKGCKQSALRDFYKEWYRPDLQSIVVVGDIDLDATEKLVKEQFSKIPVHSNSKPLQSWPVPSQKDFRVSVVSDKENPYNVIQLLYFQDSKKLKTYADYREYIKRALFNGMISARLNEITKQPNAPIVYAGANYSDLVRNKDIYGCFAVFPNDKFAEAIEVVVTENERLKRFGFTATELERMKKQIFNQFEQAYLEKDKTESKSIVSEYVSYYLTGTAVPGIENEFSYIKDLLPKITLEEVDLLSKQWITSKGENGMLILMMAENAENKIPSEKDVQTVFFKAEQNNNISKYEDKVVTTPLVEQLPTPKKVSKVVEKGYGITQWTLENGVKVLLKPTNFKDNEILFNAFSWGGTSLYSDKDFRSADASNGIQEEMGFGKFDAVSLEKYLQDKTAYVYTSVSELSESLSGKSSKKDVETLLQLTYSMFTNSRTDKEAYTSYIQQKKVMIQNASSDPESVFYDTLQYILSSYDVRSKPESDSTIAEITLKKSHDIFKERFLDPSDFVFTFVGSFNLDSIQPLIEMYLGGIVAPIKHEVSKDLGVKIPKGNLVVTVKKGEEPRSSVILLWNGEVEYTRKTRFESRGLTNLLSITLRENLREDKGGVYGVGMYPQLNSFPKGSYKMICQFACDPENLEKLVAAVKEEISAVKNNGCSEVNLNKIKETLLKEREEELKQNNFWLSFISNTDAYKEQLADLDLFENWVKSLKSEDFKRLANFYFQDNEFKQFVLSPEK